MEKIVKYVAVDGKEFADKDSCIEYENSKYESITKKYESLIITKTNNYELFNGIEEDLVDIVKIQTDEDAKAIREYVSYRSGMNEAQERSIKMAMKTDGKLLVCHYMYSDTVRILMSKFELLDRIRMI